jgi:hypothetical protein
MRKLTFGTSDQAIQNYLSASMTARTEAAWDSISSVVDPDFDAISDREERLLKTPISRAMTNWSY